MNNKKILIGNTFSLSLVRRTVKIQKISLSELRDKLSNAEIHSFWGHANTMQSASEYFGIDISQFGERKALRLSKNGLPYLDGIEFDSAFILSPNYADGFRPSIGTEVTPEQIKSWTNLKIEWL